MTYLSRRIGFSAAHRYYQKNFTEAENKKIFGTSYSENGHGHNFVLEMTVAGEVDTQTGMVINLVDIDHILKEVTTPMDHHHLNMDIEAFHAVVPTAENIAKYCYFEIKKRLPKNVNLARVRLFENENLWADYYG